MGNQFIKGLQRTVTIAVAFLLTFLPTVVLSGRASAEGTSVLELISGKLDGTAVPGNVQMGYMSQDGRYVVFGSTARLDSNYPTYTQDAHSSKDGVYLRDRISNTIKLVSVNSQGEEQNGQALPSGISGDGRYVFFTSRMSTNMGVNSQYYPADGTGYSFDFRYDTQTAGVELVSIDDNGQPFFGRVKSVSSDGHKIVVDGRLRDLVSGSNTTIEGAYFNSLSADGTKVTYSKSTNGSPYLNSIFFRDLSSGVEKLVYEGNVTSSSQGDVTKNGRYVFFYTYDTAVTSETPEQCIHSSCSYRFDVQTEELKILKTYFNDKMMFPHVYDVTTVSDDGEKIVYNDSVASQWGSFVNTSGRPEPTGLALLNLATSERFSVGWAPSWTVPQNTHINSFIISGDGTKTMFVSTSQNFGIPKQCSDDGGNPAQCSNIFLTTNVKNPSETVTEPDVTPPVLGQYSWSVNPKRLDQQSTLTVGVSDDHSGVAGGEIYDCGADGGVHTGNPMDLNEEGNQLSFFIDESIPEGSYDVCIRAFDRAGNVSLSASAPLLVGDNFDTTPPIVTGTPDIAANASGWYKTPVTITWAATDPDPSSGTPTTPAPTIANLEGVNTYTSGQSCDPLSNCSAGTYQIKLDTVVPTGTLTGSQAVIRFLGRTISGTSSDVTSGVNRVTLTAGTTTLSSDAGGGLTLNCNAVRTSCTWTATASRLPGGVNIYSLTVTDFAGNSFAISRQYTVI